MTPDPHDHLQQCREAMTAWERNFLPGAERHRLTWLVLAVLVVCVAWRVAQGWTPPQQPGASARELLAHVHPPPLPPPSIDARNAAPTGTRPTRPAVESYGVTKCVSRAGQATYSDGPCPAGSQATTVWVQPDLNLADGLSAAAREASTRSNRAVAAEVQQHERRVAQNTRIGPGECATSGARNRQFRLRC